MISFSANNGIHFFQASLKQMGHFAEEKRRKWIMQEENRTKSEKLEQGIKVPCTKCSLNVIKELCLPLQIHTDDDIKSRDSYTLFTHTQAFVDHCCRPPAKYKVYAYL